MLENEYTCANCGIDLDKSTGWEYNKDDDCMYCTACAEELAGLAELNQEP